MWRLRGGVHLGGVDADGTQDLRYGQAAVEQRRGAASGKNNRRSRCRSSQIKHEHAGARRGRYRAEVVAVDVAVFLEQTKGAEEEFACKTGSINAYSVYKRECECAPGSNLRASAVFSCVRNSSC